MLPAMTTPTRRSNGVQEALREGGLVGLGLDGEDGHKRVTQGPDFVLLGGSEETHERMQGLVIRMTEKLKRRGKRIQELSADEFADLAGESIE